MHFSISIISKLPLFDIDKLPIISEIPIYRLSIIFHRYIAHPYLRDGWVKIYNVQMVITQLARKNPLSFVEIKDSFKSFQTNTLPTKFHQVSLHILPPSSTCWPRHDPPRGAAPPWVARWSRLCRGCTTARLPLLEHSREGWRQAPAKCES